MNPGRGRLAFSVSLCLCLGVAAGRASAQTPPRPPAVRAPVAPPGATANPAVPVDAKVPVVANVQAPAQVRAGTPFEVVVRLQQADGAATYTNGGCVVRIQGRDFASTHYGPLSSSAAGKLYRDEAVVVVAHNVAPASIEVTPFTDLGGAAGRVVGAKVAQATTIVSETPLRRANRAGVRNGARLTMTEPAFLQAACSADGRAIFALVGNARDGFGLARYDTGNAAETAYLPLASFQLSKGVCPVSPTSGRTTAYSSARAGCMPPSRTRSWWSNWMPTPWRCAAWSVRARCASRLATTASPSSVATWLPCCRGATVQMSPCCSAAPMRAPPAPWPGSTCRGPAVPIPACST